MRGVACSVFVFVSILRQSKSQVFVRTSNSLQDGGPGPGRLNMGLCQCHRRAYERTHALRIDTSTLSVSVAGEQ